MVDQTQMNTNGKSKPDTATQHAPTVGGSFSSLAHDVVELAELQTQLFKMDVKASSKRIQITAALIAVGLVVLLASLPVALMAIAETVVANSEFTRPTAYGLTTLCSVLLSGLLMCLGWWKIKHGVTTFNRSTEELRNNVDWIKSTLKKSTEADARTSNREPSTRL